MTPSDFIRSIYLGDRACKAVVLNGWDAEVKVQVDCISRIRGESWDFYNEENLEGGFIVFEGVKKIEWDPNGRIPNDAITELTVEPCLRQDAKYVFRVVIASGDEKTLEFVPVRIAIFADGIALERRDGGARIRT